MTKLIATAVAAVAAFLLVKLLVAPILLTPLNVAIATGLFAGYVVWTRVAAWEIDKLLGQQKQK